MSPRHLLSAAFALVSLSVAAAAQSPLLEGLNLPDPLTSQSGEKVSSTADWEKSRRGEILELFRTQVYGRAPIGRPEDLQFRVEKTDPSAMGGAATLKQVAIEYAGPGGKGKINLVLFTPNERKGPAPAFLLICNRPANNIDPTREEKSEFWPAEQIIARGYAAAAFQVGDVDPDKHDGFKNGVHGIYDPAERKPDAWGTIAAWAWGASRVLDYLETDSGIDAKRVAVVGHSRGGKTALWAGAEDRRFALVISNDSGCTGAALARRKVGETIQVINKNFPHWFCENYKQYDGKDEQLPFDQHQLISLIAPRPAYIASASEDRWADPEGEFLAGVAASPVYELFGLKGLPATEMARPDTANHDGHVAYHLRAGKHNLTPYDWERFMTFADKRMRPTQAQASR